MSNKSAAEQAAREALAYRGAVIRVLAFFARESWEVDDPARDQWRELVAKARYEYDALRALLSAHESAPRCTCEALAKVCDALAANSTGNNCRHGFALGGRTQLAREDGISACAAAIRAYHREKCEGVGSA